MYNHKEPRKEPKRLKVNMKEPEQIEYVRTNPKNIRYIKNPTKLTLAIVSGEFSPEMQINFVQQNYQNIKLIKNQTPEAQIAVLDQHLNNLPSITKPYPITLLYRLIKMNQFEQEKKLTDAEAIKVWTRKNGEADPHKFVDAWVDAHYEDDEFLSDTPNHSRPSKEVVIKLIMAYTSSNAVKTYLRFKYAIQ